MELLFGTVAAARARLRSWQDATESYAILRGIDGPAKAAKVPVVTRSAITLFAMKKY